MALGLGLGLGFSGGKSLGAQLLESAIILNDTAPTFSRASAAFDPMTQKCVPHNLLLRSEAFDTSPWAVTSANTAVTADAAVAPDGTSTADKLTEKATTAQHEVTQDVAQSAVTYTFSVYAKAAERSWVMLYVNGAACGRYFDLANGAMGATAGALGSSAITSVGNGWYRCSITFVATAGTNSLRVLLASADNTNNYLGTLGSGVYLWGAQFAQWTAPIDYLATTSAAVLQSTVRRRRNISLGSRVAQADFIEGSRQNLLTYSEQFDNVGWGKTKSSISANAATAPDGQATADAMIEDNTSGQHYAGQAFTFSAATYTFSVYVKRGSGSRNVLVFINATGGYAGFRFNLGTGAVTSAYPGGIAGATGAIENIGLGWFRCSITVAVGAGAGGVTVYALSGTTTDSYAGDGTSSLYLWGAQLEAAAFPGTYVATASAAVTRAADSLTADLSGLVDPLGRTNRFTYSEQADHVNWTNQDTTPTANSTAAPNGTTTADTLTEGSAGNAYHGQAGTITAGAAIRAGFYFKSNASAVHTWQRIVAYNGADSIAGWWNIKTGAVGGVQNTGTASGAAITATDVGGGWYRVLLTGTVNASSTSVTVATHSASADAGAVRVNSAAYILWGASLTLASAPLDYLPTGATAYSTPPTGLRIDEGTVLAVAIPYGHLNNIAEAERALRGSSSKIILGYQSGGQALYYATDQSGAQQSVGAVPPADSSRRASAVVWGAGGVLGYNNGAADSSDSVGISVPYIHDSTVYIGSNVATSEFLHGWVLTLYWPRALTPAEVAAVSQAIAA